MKKLIIATFGLASLAFGSTIMIMPWNSAGDSVQGILNKVLREFYEADQKAATPTNYVKKGDKGFYIEDTKSKVQCAERQAGMLTVQEYQCTIKSK